MEKVLKVFSSFEEAERADDEYYASLSPQQRVDLASREPIAESLQSRGVGAAQDAVVQGLEGYPPLASCRLTYSCPLMQSLAL